MNNSLCRGHDLTIAPNYDLGFPCPPKKGDESPTVISGDARRHGRSHFQGQRGDFLEPGLGNAPCRPCRALRIFRKGMKHVERSLDLVPQHYHGWYWWYHHHAGVLFLPLHPGEDFATHEGPGQNRCRRRQSQIGVRIVPSYFHLD